jgi:hypothetical protein
LLRIPAAHQLEGTVRPAVKGVEIELGEKFDQMSRRGWRTWLTVSRTIKPCGSPGLNKPGQDSHEDGLFLLLKKRKTDVSG